MSKDPAVLFYTSDFITGTLTMTDAQRGKYIILLCLQHQQGGLTEEDMLNICKTHDEKIFTKFIKYEDGMYYNKRMKDESDRRKKYSESRSKNRKICQSYDEHMENENINDTVIDNKGGVGENELNIPFDYFWNMYAKKIDRAKCEKKWSRLTDDEREECVYYLPAYIQATPDVQFRRNPETYLNNKSWENEIIKHGVDKKHNGATPDEIAAAVGKHFASDRV